MDNLHIWYEKCCEWKQVLVASHVKEGELSWPTWIILKRFSVGKRDTVSTKGSERGPGQMKTTGVTADGPASAPANYY